MDLLTPTLHRTGLLAYVTKLTLRSISQDMTKADLYKRRSKNKQRKSSTSEPGTSYDPPIESEEQTSLIETIKNLKSRMNNSIERDVALIRANTHDTPGSEINEPKFTDDDDIPSVKPVEKTYAKSRSKLDDYIYIESSQGLDETEVAFPQTNRGKKSEESPVPRKRRKIDKTLKEDDIEVNGNRELRSRPKGKSTKAKASNSKQKRSPPKIRQKKSAAKESRAKESRPTKESIENEKTVVTRATRKRKYEETTKPVLREKGQNLSKIAEQPEVATRKIAKSKKAKANKKLTPINVDTDMRMTRSRKRRLAISLSPSEVKNVIPTFSFESDRRVNSTESNRSNKSVKAKGKKATRAKKPAGRATRTRAARR